MTTHITDIAPDRKYDLQLFAFSASAWHPGIPGRDIREVVVNFGRDHEIRYVKLGEEELVI